MKDIVTGRNVLIQSVIDLIPKKIRLIFNPNRYCVERFIEECSKKIKKDSKVLDAGAGPCPYKKFFSYCKYESTDFKDDHNILSFVCSLDKIPKKSNLYDAIVCTEVLEHVEYPQKVINEFYRILKKGGKLFITVPQGWKVHQEPYNFYNFTNYGLKSLLENSGFKKYTITSKGGFFWFLSDAIRFNGVLDQYKKCVWLYLPLKIIEFPITNIILPLILFPLDLLDKEKKWTCGYLVGAEK